MTRQSHIQVEKYPHRFLARPSSLRSHSQKKAARLGSARLCSRGHCLFTPDWFSVPEWDRAASRCYKLLCWCLRDGSHACAACSLGEFWPNEGRLRFKEVVLEPGWCSSIQRAVLKSSFKSCYSSIGVKILRATLAKVTLCSFILFSPHYHYCCPDQGRELVPFCKKKKKKMP